MSEKSHATQHLVIITSFSSLSPNTSVTNYKAFPIITFFFSNPYTIFSYHSRFYLRFFFKRGARQLSKFRKWKFVLRVNLMNGSEICKSSSDSCQGVSCRTCRTVIPKLLPAEPELNVNFEFFWLRQTWKLNWQNLQLHRIRKLNGGQGKSRIVC